MNIGIIIETNEPEKSWNGVRFANTAIKNGHDVKIFLMGAGVEIEHLAHGQYNAKKQLDEFVRNKGTVLACGTCLTSRNQNGSDVCPVSTMVDCLNMVTWAERVITF
jgi:uncharacterized protein involved in oxidation of intracellular sulfur